MRKFLRAFLFIFISINSNSQNIKKCYRQINAGEYEKADAGLYQLERKGKQPITTFLFAELLSKKDYSNRSLSLAYLDIHSLYPDTSGIIYSKSKKKKYANDFGFRYANFKTLHDEICHDALDSTRKKNTIDEYNFYLNTYTSSPFLKIAITERNVLAWNSAQSKNSAAAITEFIKLYPDAVQIPDAKKIYDQLNYMESTFGKTATDYSKFITNNPESPFLEEAKITYGKLLFNEETSDQTPESYYHFLINHPNNPFVNKAWEKLKATDRNLLTPLLPDLISVYNGTEIENDLWTTLLHHKITIIDSANIQSFSSEFPTNPFHSYLDSLLKSLSLKTKFFLLTDKFAVDFQITDTDSVTVFQFKYDDALEFSEGYAAVAITINDELKYGYINKFGETVVQFQYNDAFSFRNGLALVAVTGDSSDTKYGFINPFNEFIIPPVHEDADTFSEGLCLVRNEKGLYGFLNEEGVTALPFFFIDANDFREGIAPVQLDSSWTYINHDGTMAIKKVFKGAYSFSDSLAAAKDETGKWGYINHAGDWVIPPEYLSASSFKNGTATVLVLSKPTKKNKIPLQVEKVIDKTGKVLQ